MKKNLVKYSIGTVALAVSLAANAIPTLQVGAPGGVGEGTYANYSGSTINPVESDTAVVSGSSIYAAGVYQNDKTLLLGGKYNGGVSGGKTYEAGKNWSDLGFNSSFDTAGAVMMATAYGAGTITVGGNAFFYQTPTFESGFVMPNPPSNHDPVKEDSNTAYYFFDIGNFTKTANVVVDFATESGNADGQIKALGLNITGFDWVHFDVLALGTSTTNQAGQETCISDPTKPNKPPVCTTTTYLANTGLDGNPGSHDVTWKNPNGGGGGGGGNIPEPGSLALLGLGLLGLAAARRKSAAV